MNGLTKEQLGHFRRVLEEQRDGANRDIFAAQDQAQAAGDNGDTARDESDQAVRTDAIDRTLDQGSRSTDRFDEIERALARMDRGDYGRCVQCKNEIGARRLEALPTAEKCADCAIESDHRPTPSL